jgi:hypothetical protein
MQAGETADMRAYGGNRFWPATAFCYRHESANSGHSMWTEITGMHQFVSRY